MLLGPQDGFFYKGMYFLLPEGYEHASAFLEAMQQSALPITVQAVVLQEKCEVEARSSYELGVSIAPYFIADYQNGAEAVTIEDASDVYPVQVELLSQQAYNDRLRALVTEHCPGCRGFGGLTKNDSSLSGHFDEISLDGVCFYRWETRNSPRSFYRELTYMGSLWNRYGFSQYSADDVMDNFKQDLKLTYTSGAMMEDDDKRCLHLYVKKSSLFLTALTDVLARYVTEQLDDGYTIRLAGRAAIDEAAVAALVAPGKIAATRKEFKKYGVALGMLEWNPEHDAKVAGFMRRMVEVGMAYVLYEGPGKYACLLTGEADALVWMRYAAPMLQQCEARITVYDALKTARYVISYDMPETMIDLAPAEEPKAKKPTKKQLKAEVGKVLKRDQVKALFAYVDIRLSEAGCDHTRRFTDIWLKETLSAEQYEAAVEEIENMGGFCDCEVLMNCYEDYDLED